MSLASKNKNVYVCKTGSFGVNKECRENSISEEVLKEAILQTLNTQIKMVDTKINLRYNTIKADDLKSIKKRINKLQTEKLLIYEKYKEKQLLLEDYKREREKISNNLDELELILARLNKEEDEKLLDNYTISIHQKFLNSKSLTDEMLKVFVDKIYIDSQKNIEINFKY